MPVIDDIRESQQKLKGKGFKYKFKYFWEYYRVATLVAICVIAALASIIYTIATNKDSAFNVILLNGYNSPPVEEFAEYAGIDMNEFDVTLDYNYDIDLSANYDETSYVNMQKLMASISAKTVDSVVGDELTVINYADTQIFSDLTAYFSKEYLDSLGDKVIYYTYKDEETGAELNTVPIAIYVTDAPKLVQNNCFLAKDVVYTIIANSEHTDNALKFYYYITETNPE